MGKPNRSAKVRLHRSGLWFANIGPPKNGRASPVYAPRDSVRTEAQAWRWLDKKLSEMEAKKVSARDPDFYGLCQLYLAWAEGRAEKGHITRGHYNSLSSKLTLAWETKVGGLPLRGMKASAIGPAEVDAAAEAWAADGYSPHYVAGTVRAVKGAYSWASKRIAGRHPPRILADNPVKDATIPVVPHSSERFAERAEIARFLRFFRAYAEGAHRGYEGTRKPRTHRGRKSLECRFDRLTILAERVIIHSGCRPGEACSAWWDDIKWDAGRTATGHRFAKVVIPPERWKAGKKTGRSRTIYLSPILTRAIRREFDRPDRHPVHIFAHRCGPRDRLKGADRLTGAPWDSGSSLAAKVRKVRRLAIAAGVDFAETGPNALTNYRWRHTAISELLMLGIDLATVAELTGTSADMIRRTYGHLLDKHLATAAEALHGRKRG